MKKPGQAYFERQVLIGRMERGEPLDRHIVGQPKRKHTPMPDDANKIVATPADEALFAYDAEHNVQPPRITAEKIAKAFGYGPDHSMVDAISKAIEDALNHGWGRASAYFKRILKR